ncbi:hypothetical protein A2U01_0080187, partial [Trifolium medium]|nr:hypothetical protein [Trifolium medium]
MEHTSPILNMKVEFFLPSLTIMFNNTLKSSHNRPLQGVTSNNTDTVET